MNKENIKKEEFICVGTTLYQLVNQPRLNGGYVKEHTEWNCETRHGRKYRTLSDYFDEMMKEYIIPLVYRYLYPHQTFIKGVPMMKGKAEAQCLSFFRQLFDEKMMNAYHAAIQIVIHRSSSVLWKYGGIHIRRDRKPKPASEKSKGSNGRCATEYHRYVRGNSMGAGTTLLRKM